MTRKGQALRRERGYNAAKKKIVRRMLSLARLFQQPELPMQNAPMHNDLGLRSRQIHRDAVNHHRRPIQILQITLIPTSSNGLAQT